MAGSPHVPQRTCIGCRTVAPRAQLLRLCIDANGELIVDVQAVKPGRGAWIHPDPSCLAFAQRRGAFGRALHISGSLDVAPIRSWIVAAHERQLAAAPTTKL